MFRSPQMLTLSCPLRSLLLREYHAAACSEHSAAARTLQERSSEAIHGCKEGSSCLTKTLPCSTQLPVLSSKEDHLLRETSPKRLCCKDFSQNSLVGLSCLQSWRMPACQNLFSSPAQTFKKEFLVRHLSSCADQRWVSNHLFSKPQLPSVYLSRTRAASYAAPREAVAWRDCLSPENENRCRQRLGPNVKLYEMDRQEKRGWIQSKAKAKAKARWASVLVSLCSVDGEPAFLFTLRSSMLKGRHKGDVRWARWPHVNLNIQCQVIELFWFVIVYSFAGGKSDPSDSDVVATALREAREELGVNVATDKVWGILKPLRDWVSALVPLLIHLNLIYNFMFFEGHLQEGFWLLKWFEWFSFYCLFLSYQSGMMIAPVLANLGPIEELTFKPNPGEVQFFIF